MASKSITTEEIVDKNYNYLKLSHCILTLLNNLLYGSLQNPPLFSATLMLTEENSNRKDSRNILPSGGYVHAALKIVQIKGALEGILFANIKNGMALDSFLP